MVEGSVQKFLKEVSLLDQVFVKAADGKQTVEQMLKGRKTDGEGLHPLRGGRRHREEAGRLRRRSGRPVAAAKGAVKTGVPDPGARATEAAVPTLPEPPVGRPWRNRMPAYKRILLKLSGEALMGDDAYGINRATIVRMVRRSGGDRAGLRGGRGDRRRQHLPRRGRRLGRHGPRHGRLHGHAGHGDELAGPGRHDAPGGHDRARDVAPSASSRWSSPTCAPRRCSTSKKARWWFSPPAPATPSSPPTPPPRCAAPRSAPRSCSRPPRSTASTPPTRRRIRRRHALRQHQFRRGHFQEPAGDGRPRFALCRDQKLPIKVFPIFKAAPQARGAGGRRHPGGPLFDEVERTAMSTLPTSRRTPKPRWPSRSEAFKNDCTRSAPAAPTRHPGPGARRLLRLDGADFSQVANVACSMPAPFRPALGKGHGRRSRRRSASPTSA